MLITTGKSWLRWLGALAEPEETLGGTEVEGAGDDGEEVERLELLTIPVVVGLKAETLGGCDDDDVCGASELGFGSV
jgi:hypothetical protein